MHRFHQARIVFHHASPRDARVGIWVDQLVRVVTVHPLRDAVIEDFSAGYSVGKRQRAQVGKMPPDDLHIDIVVIGAPPGEIEHAVGFESRGPRRVVAQGLFGRVPRRVTGRRQAVIAVAVGVIVILAVERRLPPTLPPNEQALLGSVQRIIPLQHRRNEIGVDRFFPGLKIRAEQVRLRADP